MKKKYTDHELHDACELLHAAAEALYDSARELSSLTHREDGMLIPYEILEDAGIAPWDPVEITVSDGRITLEHAPEWTNDWTDYEDDEVLDRLPDEVRDLLEELNIHPATVRDVILRGGYEFE